MTEQLITEIQRKMLPYLNNEQLMHLRDAMTETLVGATITYDSGSIPAEETDQKIDTTMHYAMVKQHNVKLAHRKYIG